MDEDEEEESEETTMEGELFRRIMSNASRKHKHSYRLSYAHEVGSSFDPDIEDVSRWEDELQDHPSQESRTSALTVTPEDLDDEELQAYAEEYSALADFEDLENAEWDWDDIDEANILDDLRSPPAEDAMDMA